MYEIVYQTCSSLINKTDCGGFPPVLPQIDEAFYPDKNLNNLIFWK